MVTYFLLSACTWTFKGILCSCRFLWICPYNAIQFLPRERAPPVDSGSCRKQLTVCPAASERKASTGIPGSPEQTSALQRRLAKAERDILSLKTRLSSQRASWEIRFNELQRHHNELCTQLMSEVREVSSQPGESGLDGNQWRLCDHHRVPFLSSPRSNACPCSQSPCSSSPCSSRPASVMSSNLRSISIWNSLPKYIISSVNTKLRGEDPPRLTGASYRIPPWTYNWATGSESCCRQAGSVRAPSVSWAACRGSQSSTWAWSWRRPTTCCPTAVTVDTSNARLGTEPLYPSASS